MPNPVVLAALRTLEASRFTLFKAEHFGKVVYLSDENGCIFKLATYQGKTYFIKAMPEVIESPLDFVWGIILKLIRVAVIGTLILHAALYLGGYYGNFFSWS